MPPGQRGGDVRYRDSGRNQRVANGRIWVHCLPTNPRRVPISTTMREVPRRLSDRRAKRITMSVIDRFLRHNTSVAATLANEDMPARPALAVAIVTCMDARVNPFALLGLQPGEAHVIRNAGGAVTDDVIRSLAVSQHVLGTQEIVLILHTDCGMLTATDDELKDEIERDTGVRPAFAMETFSDLDDQLRRSVSRLATNRFLRHRDRIHGFVYDVKTGRLRSVG